MFEIRIHGRGGQGAKSAAQLIAEAALEEGKFIQAFSEYGPERTGAPVVAYVRISDQEIKTHEPVIYPKAVLVLDKTLIEVVDVIKGLKKEGVLIINSSEKDQEKFKQLFAIKCNVKFLDASKIALEFIKKDKPNTAMLGALIKITQVIKLENLIKVIEKHFLAKTGKQGVDANIIAIKSGYEWNF